MNRVRHSLRRLAREPGFVLTVVAVIALCLGANLLIYAVLHSVLLRPLPFPEAERLHVVYNSYPNAGLERSGASIRDYFTRRDGALAGVESVAAYRQGSEAVGAPGSVARLPVMRITPEFFDTLGVTLAAGQGFSDADMDSGGAQVVIVSDRYRRTRMDADGAAIGQQIDIGGLRPTVVGVLPSGFSFLSSSADLFLPLVSTDEQRGLNALHGEQAEMLVRLRHGVSAEQALQQIEAHHLQHSRGYPWAQQVAEAGFGIHVANLQEDHVASTRPVILLLQAGALALLLVGAANLLNLLLLRHASAQADASIRRALGARRNDLLLPGIIDILVLCVAGGALGVLLAGVGLGALQRWAGASLPLGADLAMGTGPVTVAVVASLALAAALSAVYAWLVIRQPDRLGPAAATRNRSDDHRTVRVRWHFAVLQMAMAFMLLAGASALGFGLEMARHSNPGFDASRSVVAAIDLPSARYPTAGDRLQLARRAIDALSGIPGVEAVGISTNVPVRGRGSFNDRQAIHVVGHQPTPGHSPLLHNRYGVAGDYFRSMGIELLQGRYLDERDLDGDLRPVVVDQDFADFYWPGGSALGQRLFNGPDPRGFDAAHTVVGVVAPVRQEEVHAGAGNGTLYLPYPELAHSTVFVTVRTGLAPQSQVGVLRQYLAELDPALALDDIRTMQARIDDTLVGYRAPALLSSVFAAAAVLLAAIGCFGLLGYVVSRGRREIGLRIALGAMRTQIARRYVAFGLRVFAIGAGIGLAGSALLLYTVAQTVPDMPTAGAPALLTSAATLCAVAVFACLAPALRAASTSPLVVLSER